MFLGAELYMIMGHQYARFEEIRNTPDQHRAHLYCNLTRYCITFMKSTDEATINRRNNGGSTDNKSYEIKVLVTVLQSYRNSKHRPMKLTEL